jgi:glycerophosphoryl diester phosphodiesterase
MDISWLTARPIAHRGLHDISAGVLENTLGAAARAVEKGYNIEVDLLLSADEEIVVFHDDTLDRLSTATGRVDRRTMAELRAIPLKGTTDRIPTLDDLLALVDGRVGLCLELKSEYPRRPDDRLVTRVAERLAAYRGPVVTKSFDPEVVAAANRIMPAVAHGIVADGATDLAHYGRFTRIERFVLRHLLHAPRTRPKFVSYCVNDLPAPGPWLARKVFGLPVISWTVRSEEARRRVLAHADQIVFEGFDPDTTGAA